MKQEINMMVNKFEEFVLEVGHIADDLMKEVKDEIKIDKLKKVTENARMEIAEARKKMIDLMR